MPVIMDSSALYYLTVLTHFGLYIIAPIWLFVRGWPIVGGVVMLASTILPIAGQIWFTNSEMPGFGLLLVVEFPLALMVLLIGVVVTLSRWFTRRRVTGRLH